MRIVGWDEFLTLPAGTLFYTYVPHVVSDLAIKDDTYPDNSDYLVSYLDNFNITPGESFEVTYGDSLQRAANYSPGQMFAVFEGPDLINLMKVCHRAIEVLAPVVAIPGPKGPNDLVEEAYRKMKFLLLVEAELPGFKELDHVDQYKLVTTLTEATLPLFKDVLARNTLPNEPAVVSLRRAIAAYKLT